MSEALQIGRLVDVNGHRLWCTNNAVTEHNDDSHDSHPSVVVLPGAGLVGLDYWPVFDRLRGRVRPLLYDRRGTGWSIDPSTASELPRTPTQVTDELRALLAATGTTGPHILVGHSLGAFYARRYAQRFPDEVAGLILLDPGHEDIADFLPAEAAALNSQLQADAAELPELTSEQLQAARQQLTQLYTDYPTHLSQPLIDYHLRQWRVGIDETANFETEVYAELRNGGPLPDVPMLILTAGGRNPAWEGYADQQLIDRVMDGISKMHQSMLDWVSRSEQRELPGAVHQYLQLEQPETIVSAVLDVITQTAWVPPPPTE